MLPPAIHLRCFTYPPALIPWFQCSRINALSQTPNSTVFCYANSEGRPEAATPSSYSCFRSPDLVLHQETGFEYWSTSGPIRWKGEVKCIWILKTLKLRNSSRGIEVVFYLISNQIGCFKLNLAVPKAGSAILLSRCFHWKVSAHDDGGPRSPYTCKPSQLSP